MIHGLSVQAFDMPQNMHGIWIVNILLLCVCRWSVQGRNDLIGFKWDVAIMGNADSVCR